MNNEPEPFAPMPSPPPEIARALGWRITEDNEEPEERIGREFFQRTTEVPNPWIQKSAGDKRLDYVPEEDGEDEFADGVAPVAKLFEPKPPTATAPNLNQVPLPVEQDDDEKIYYAALAPLQKLFAGNSISTTTAPAATEGFRFTKRATPTPATKEKPKLKYTKVVIDEDTWNEGRDESGELISMMLVTDESE